MSSDRPASPTLAWLAEELAEFYPPDEARLWLFSPHRLLEGQRPADRIERIAPTMFSR